MNTEPASPSLAPENGCASEIAESSLTQVGNGIDDVLLAREGASKEEDDACNIIHEPLPACKESKPKSGPQHPRLPCEIWFRIFSHTDLLTCMRMSQFPAAKQFIAGAVTAKAKGLTWPQDIVDTLMEGGYAAAVRLLTDAGVGKPHLYLAAGDCNLAMLKKFHPSCLPGQKCGAQAMVNAACNGHRNIMKWLYENCPASRRSHAMDACAYVGFLEGLKFLHGKPETEGCSKEAVELACLEGHTEVVDWLQKNRTEGAGNKAMAYACGSGHLELVKSVWQAYKIASEQAMNNAAVGNHKEVVTWLHELFPLDSSTEAMILASGRGLTDMIEHLWSSTSPQPDQRCIHFAAVNGHFAALQKLLALQICTLSACVIEYAAQGGHAEIVKFVHKYLVTERYPEQIGVRQWTAQLTVAAKNAFLGKHHAVREWLQQVCPDIGEIDDANARGEGGLIASAWKDFEYTHVHQPFIPRLKAVWLDNKLAKWLYEKRA